MADDRGRPEFMVGAGHGMTTQTQPTRLSDLTPAPYNPRTITQASLDALALSLEEFGDLSGFVFNLATQRLVGGHQRRTALLAAYPDAAVIHDPNRGAYVKAGDLEFPVRLVNWDEGKEKLANLAANNPHVQGAFVQSEVDLILASVTTDAGLLGIATDLRIMDLAGSANLIGKSGDHFRYSSKNNEWYTPQPVLDAARRVLGKIDLDPASCEEANQRVGAGQIFTIEDNGLDRDWFGSVWCNPPYGTTAGASNQAAWTDKAIREFDSGRVKEAVLLVTFSPDRNWFRPLWRYPLCAFDDRIKFILPGTEEGQASPVDANVCIYLGPRSGFVRFKREFLPFGVVIDPKGVFGA